MKKFDILPNADGLKIRVVSTTKAGFLSAALEGTFAAAGPRWREKDEGQRALVQETEQPFKIEADDFNQLTANFLNDALRQAAANQEAFVGVRLALVTDKRLEGAYLGQPADGFKTEIRAVSPRGFKVQKNQLGYWETILTFDS